MKVYISGPMTGRPAFNFPAFFAAAETVRQQGHEPLNPAEGVTELDRPWNWYMRRAIRLLLEADEIWMLAGWADSKGARLERDLATRLGMQVRYLNAVSVPVKR
ncbi:DUF4406 domain-containing protein [Alicyclobacillus sp. ALC3]|uniref:DUF4406 domain-containing protein n=1 Tax=Alicyclobacillus sp. ALC3 TaxID=2796143 RepID=UPI002379D1DB|nr:DUF4406 domain-containing protein [Alicyclobacillus sp. ALC3]WDL96919.1 DUF4406 domain-containing protein [Alicyclobacillus sp. ALC3]